MSFQDSKSASPAPGVGEVMREARLHWGWFVAFGVLTIAAGAFALAYVGVATVASIAVIAISAIFAGVFEIVLGFGAKTWGKMFLVIALGALYVVAGLFMWNNPLLASALITLMLGVAFIVSGLMRVFLAFDALTRPARWMLVLSGVVTLGLGALVLAWWPGSSIVLLGALLGVDLVTTGAGWLSLGLALRRATT